MRMWRAALAVMVLVAAMLAPSSAAAATAQLTYQLDGARVTAKVTGPQRTGAWRIRFVAPGRQQRTEFILRTGDITWSGLVRVARRTDAGWRVTRTIRLDRALAGRARITACTAGICWDSADFRLPRAGNQTFGVTVRLARQGRYRVSGAVQLCREAFLFGPWQGSGAYPITR